jgi:hypothetical protein
MKKEKEEKKKEENQLAKSVIDRFVPLPPSLFPSLSCLVISSLFISSRISISY